MKLEVHTLAYGSADWMDACGGTFDSWCQRHGYQNITWGEVHGEGYPCVKFCERDMLKTFLKGDSTHFVYIDADVWIHPEAPAFPEFEGLLMATDAAHAEHQQHWSDWCHEHFSFRPEGFQYSNAGVWAIDRKAAEIFLKHFKEPFIEAFMEQHQFNAAAYLAREDGMEFARLPQEWNRWGRDLNPAWFLHLWGDQKLRDLETYMSLGLHALKPDGKTYCFMPEGYPAQDKYLVLQFVKDSGLGNRFFELAAGLHLADRLKLPLLLNWQPTPKRDFGLEHFGVGVLPFTEFPIVSHKLGQGNAEMVDKSAHAIHDSTERFPAVSHPFQAEECFALAVGKVRELFKLDPYPLEVPEGKTPVAIQVRRGDYLKHSRLNVVTKEYFLNGIDFIRRQIAHPHFFVISDDPAWCRQQFGYLPDVTVMPPQSAIDGLRTMVACKASVISNSTFGWWGAWLGEDGPVVVPERWTNNMRFYGKWEPVPARWHKVSVSRAVTVKPVVSLPPPLMAFREFPQQFERAIVVPWHARGDKWQSLRYCLRSVHQFFEDETCPIVVLGTARPPWLLFSRHRVHYIEAWAYQEALMHGVQIAAETVFLNDDICFLKKTGWDDLRRPYHFGEVPDTLLADFMANPNPWRDGFRKAVARLSPEGPVLNYSTHTPYLFERDKAVSTLKEFGIDHKHPFELYYFNRHATSPKPMNGERAGALPFGEARFLNHTDHRLDQALKDAIANLFPNHAPWELKTKISQ